MIKKDLKRYSVYLPIRWQHQFIFEKIEKLCPGWTDNVWKNKFVSRFLCKVFWGQKQYIRILEKDMKTYRYIPIETWLDLSNEQFCEKTWQWIREQKSKYLKLKSKKAKVETPNVLDL